jgi:WD40 repeat protein
MNVATSVLVEPIASASIQTNPFPGLRPFQAGEEYLFFGRENQVDAMVNKLASTRFLAVVGTSGSGKSSLVNCGLRPALHGGIMARAGTTWRIAQFRPGGEPIRAMARALARDGVLFHDYQAGGLTLAEIIDTTLRMSKLGLIDIYEQANLDEDINLLVVVDQFEELFRYRQLGAGQQESVYGGTEAAAAFVNLLVEAKEHSKYPIYIVLTMRSDFLGDCAQFPGLAEAINAGQYLVPRMTRDERRAAISGPARVGGAEISPVLLTRLVNDVGDNPDQLSILQHALNRTWARWQNEGGATGPLDLAHYEAIGTMARALDQHAERAYKELLTVRQQQICEKIFKALTDKANDPRGIRRPTTLGTLCALAGAKPEEVTTVIEVFRKPSRSFLMPPAGEALETETVIDISHESLMRVWQRLINWADEEAQSAQMYRRLADAAARHAVGKASLWRDPDLQLALDWRDKSQPNETWSALYGPGFSDACTFLRDSETACAEELEKERQRVEAERIAKERELEQAQALAEARRQRARSRLIKGAAVLCSTFAVVAILMWWNAQIAAEQATEARDRALKAEEEAKLEAKNATLARIDASIAEYEATLLRQAAEEKAKEETELRTKAKAAEIEAEKQADLARAGKIAAQSILFADPSVNVPLDTAALLAIASYRLQPSFDARRGLLAPMTRLAQVRKILVSPTAPNGVTFSPDGKTIVSASDNGKLIQWDVETGQMLRELVGRHDARVWTVTFSPDSKMIVSGDDKGGIVFWDATSGKLLSGPEKNHKKWVNKIAFSPNGKTMVSASDDGTLIFWDPATRTANPRHGGNQYNEEPVNSFAFGSQGKTIVSGHSDGRIIMWDAQEHRQIEVVRPGGSPVFSIAISPNGQIVSGHEDGTVAFWSRGQDGKFGAAAEAREHHDWVWSLAFSNDGNRLASASKDGTIVIWDPDHRKPAEFGKDSSKAILRAHKNEVRSVAFSPDPRGKTLVSASYDNSLILWDLDVQMNFAQVVDADPRAIRSLAFRQDGKTLVTGSDSGTLKIWDSATRKALATRATDGKQDEVLGVAFSPDGRVIASAHKSGALRLWDGVTLTLLRQSPMVHEGGTLAVAFSPEGKTLVSTGKDKKVRLSDPGTLQQITDPADSHGDVRTIAFSPDGKSVISAGDDLMIRFWSASGLQKIGETPRRHDRNINALAYSTKRIVASASDDGTVILWDADTRQPRGEPLRGHRGAANSNEGVKSLSFSHDGSMLASAASDRTVILWDVETRLPLEPLNGHSAEALAVSFSPDGRTLVSADKRGDLFFWDVDPESWRRKLCAKLTRNLSQSEWNTYVGKEQTYQEQCPGLPKSSS